MCFTHALPCSFPNSKWDNIRNNMGQGSGSAPVSVPAILWTASGLTILYYFSLLPPPPPPKSLRQHPRLQPLPLLSALLNLRPPPEPPPQRPAAVSAPELPHGCPPLPIPEVRQRPMVATFGLPNGGHKPIPQVGLLVSGLTTARVEAARYIPF